MEPLALLSLDPLAKNVEIVLTLVAFIWIYSWAKNNLGSPKLAVLFALIVVFLTFWTFPILIWIIVALFVLAYFGGELIDKVNIFK
jgi:chromate transport protein ChrA